MADKLTPKQEKFCQKYIETGNASEAYRLAYNAKGMKTATIHRNATALMDNNKVATRIEILQLRHQKRHDVTIDSITEELHESRLLATADRQHSAAISASLGKAKLHGLIVEKNEHMGKDGGPIVVATKEQRDAAVAAARAADS